MKQVDVFSHPFKISLDTLGLKTKEVTSRQIVTLISVKTQIFYLSQMLRITLLYELYYIENICACIIKTNTLFEVTILCPQKLP